MNKEQQRIAIAEWMGWARISHYDNSIWGTPPQGLPKRQGGMAILDFETPNYPECLNAMHEAEKKLDEAQCSFYMHNLTKVVGSGWNYFTAWAHPTASQRSEALCRTLWPERFQ